MDQDLFQDDSLIQDFLVESSELVEQLVQDLVVLESAPTEPETLNRIFRALHTIKGTSGFLGFEEMVRLSHRAEDVLNDLRKSIYVASPHIVDLLLRVVDVLRSMLDDIRAKRSGTYELDPIVSALESVRTQAPAAQQQTSAVARPRLQPHSRWFLIPQ
jgi:two-component system, chemotaxis family, sensor kinase CheA